MKRFRVSDLAEQDLDAIWHYIVTESGSIEIADGFIDTLTEHFALFTHTPEAGTARSDIAEGVRGFPVRNYIIYYRVEGSHVLISRILHGSRDQFSAFHQTPDRFRSGE
jgi:plasmid stabilization system protein ParE